MNIYFTASIHAKQTDPTIDESYRSIVAKLNELGYKVESDHVLNFDQEFMETIDDEHRVRFYRKVLEMINKADIVIAEMTYASASIGHEVSVDLEKNKPVLILCRKGNNTKV